MPDCWFVKYSTWIDLSPFKLFLQLAEMKQTYQQYNDIIDDAMQNMNNTIAEKVGRLISC